MHLKRLLNQRQISMIAIGGSIGTGLFLASGSVIHSAGPGGALLAYGVMGVMVYFLMTSLGEMAAFMPTSGSFYTYAARFVDPALGFALCVFIIAGQNYTAFTGNHIDWEGIMVSYMGVPIFLSLWLGYKWKRKTKLIHLHQCDLEVEN